MKNPICYLENTVESFNNRLREVGGRISEMEENPCKYLSDKKQEKIRKTKNNVQN